ATAIATAPLLLEQVINFLPLVFRLASCATASEGGARDLRSATQLVSHAALDTRARDVQAFWRNRAQRRQKSSGGQTFVGVTDGGAPLALFFLAPHRPAPDAGWGPRGTRIASSASAIQHTRLHSTQIYVWHRRNLQLRCGSH